ncbi:hypothetical protein CF121_08225 [Aeromonas media]|nr:hypothetical protein CF121_08225 [Aeromonas media]
MVGLFAFRVITFPDAQRGAARFELWFDKGAGQLTWTAAGLAPEMARVNPDHRLMQSPIS